MGGWEDMAFCGAPWSWHLPPAAPRDPPGNPGRKKPLGSSGRSPGSPFPAPRQHQGDKGGSCSWQGSVRGLLEERRCCPTASSPAGPHGAGQGGPGPGHCHSEPWGDVCSAHSFISLRFSRAQSLISENFSTFSDLLLYLKIRLDQPGHFRMKPLLSLV